MSTPPPNPFENYCQETILNGLLVMTGQSEQSLGRETTTLGPWQVSVQRRTRPRPQISAGGRVRRTRGGRSNTSQASSPLDEPQRPTPAPPACAPVVVPCSDAEAACILCCANARNAVLNCGHQFCHACALRCESEQGKCPTCRADIAQVIRMFQ